MSESCLKVRLELHHLVFKIPVGVGALTALGCSWKTWEYLILADAPNLGCSTPGPDLHPMCLAAELCEKTNGTGHFSFVRMEMVSVGEYSCFVRMEMVFVGEYSCCGTVLGAVSQVSFSVSLHRREACSCWGAVWTAQDALPGLCSTPSTSTAGWSETGET